MGSLTVTGGQTDTDRREVHQRNGWPLTPPRKWSLKDGQKSRSAHSFADIKRTMMPLVLLLQLSLVVVITHSQHYAGSDLYEEAVLTADDIASFENGSYLKSYPDDLKSPNYTSIPMDSDDQGNHVGYNGSDAHRTRRNAHLPTWPDKRVPYAISKSYWQWQIGMIREAMRDIEDETCIKFETKTSADRAYVFIAPISGCSSYRGPSPGGGRQILSLTYWCFYHGSILHELMHALGFDHEHQRPDRSSYITIYWDNILSDFEDDYRISAGNRYGIEYDYDSVMHYDSWAHCTCTWIWYKTMTRTDTGGNIYSAQKLSDKDVQRINKHYSCP